MSEEKIKVIDKRMFGPDGELREEYRDLDKGAGAAGPEVREEGGAAAVPAGPPPEASPQAEPAEPSSPATDSGAQADPDAPRLEIPAMGPGERPSFFDLVVSLAEPVPIYLGDAELPDGQSAESLEAARHYIDLLDVLREKTRGNLGAQESAFLEDLLYRFRMRYVQKRG